MNKRILLLGFTIALLLAIPISLWALSQQQKPTTHANKSSTLSFSQLNGPITAGQKFNLDVILDPGQNQVSFVKMVVSYNPQFLTVTGGGGFVQVSTGQYSNQFTKTLDGPTYDESNNKCLGTTCTMTLSFGLNPQVDQPLSGAPATIASISFTALASANGSVVVGFSGGTQVLSVASGDQPSENVANWTSTTINIVGPSPTQSPSPTQPGATGGPTNTPGASTPTNTPAPTGGSGGSGGSNPGPVCNSLTADQTSTTSAPLSSVFTVNGSDPTTTVSKVTFNFGDGTVQDITTGGGIGTQAINAQINHTYQQTGTFTATASLTDANNNVSAPSSCSQVITVGTPSGSGGSGGSGGGTQPTAQPTQQQQLMKTGPGDTFVAIGIVSAFLAIAGAALFVGGI